MQLLRNIITYKASLPRAVELEQHLATKPFAPVLETQIGSSGFVPVHSEDGRLVAEFPGGYAFRLRMDCKPISVKALRMAQYEAIHEIEVAQSRSLTPEESGQIKEAILTDLVRASLPERSELTAYYHIESRTLMVPTTNKATASRMVGLLVEACGAVETSTIWVSNVKGGLTTRLKRYFKVDEFADYDTEEAEAAFDGFTIGEYVVMKGDRGKASFDLENLQDGKQGLIEALGKGMEAERMELVHADAVSFRLTKDFHVRKIEFLGGMNDQEQEFETPEALWSHHAGVQVTLLVALVTALCDLFGYQEKTADQADAPASPAA